LAGWRTDAELCTRARTTYVALNDARAAAVSARTSAPVKPGEGVAGGSADQAIEGGHRFAGSVDGGF
jgi:hypothetical protein